MLGTYVDLIPSSLKARGVIGKAQNNQHRNYHILELDHCYIRYRIEGQGSHTVVFAADPPVSLEDYDDVIAHLKSHYRVVILELPGFGFSLSKLSMSFKFDACVNVLMEFLSQLKAAPYVLAFPCAAGYFAIRIAEKNTSEISHLVMLQTPDWQQEQCWKQGLDPKNIISTPVAGQLVLSTMKRKVAHQWVQFSCQDTALIHRIQCNCTKNFDQGASYSLASALQESLPAQQPLLNKVSQPSIAIYGVADRSHQRTDFHSVTKYFHNIKITGLEGVGHFPELEAPQAVTEMIESLIQQTE